MSRKPDRPKMPKKQFLKMLKLVQNYRWFFHPNFYFSNIFKKLCCRVFTLQSKSSVRIFPKTSSVGDFSNYCFISLQNYWLDFLHQVSNRQTIGSRRSLEDNIFSSVPWILNLIGQIRKVSRSRILKHKKQKASLRLTK